MSNLWLVKNYIYIYIYILYIAIPRKGKKKNAVKRFSQKENFL
jgi:hypothetical protein